MMPIKNLRVEQEPYPHLRDDGGCVLARDYQDPEKLAHIVRCVNAHDEMVRLLRLVRCFMSDADSVAKSIDECLARAAAPTDASRTDAGVE